MAIAQFEPIIGDSFSDLGNQRFRWSQANNQTESANIARANEAEQVRNQWNARVQAIQQQQADAQDRADEAAQQEAESQRRFGIQTDLSRESNATRYGQEAARTDYYNKALAKQQADATTDATAIDSAAQTLAPRVHETGTAMSDAQAEKERAYAALQSKPAELQATMPDDVFYNGKIFTSQNPKSAKAASAANLALASAQTDYSAAATRYAAQQKNFNDLTAHASKNYGLEVSHDGDQWVIKNPRTQRTYRPDGTAKPGPKTADETAAPAFAGTNRFAPTTAPWPGFTDFGATDTAQPSTDVQPVNRFTTPTDTMAAPTAVAPQTSASPFTEGQMIRSKRDGKMYRVTNGVPVLVQ